MLRAREVPPQRRIALLSFVLLAAPFASHAVDLDAKVEGGVALPLSAPQSNRFDAGGAGTLKGLIGVEGGYVDLAAGLTFIGLHAADGYASDSAGTAWAPSLGLRIQRPRESEEMRLLSPHPRESFHGARPWLDADLLYVRTGGLDRAGFAGAVGLAFPVGEARSLWLGPFVRYFQILQQNKSGVDDRDGKLLIIGLSFEAGTRLVRPTRPEPATVYPSVAAIADIPAAPIARSDRLVAKSFSSSRPIESNATESGREANRRVEFVMQLTILKEETK